MSHFIRIASLMLIFCIQIYSQFTEIWENRYSTPSSDKNTSTSRIAKDSEGNVYVSGGAKNRYSYFLIKYNAIGVQQWYKTYDGTRPTCIASGLAVDQDDNVIISGEWGSGANGDDIVTIKYKPNGDTIWTRHYDDSRYASSEWGREMLVDDSGNIYVAGLDNIGLSGPNSANIGVIIKIDSAGNTVWERFIQEDSLDISLIDLWQIEIDGSGNLYVGGSRSINGNSDILIAKYSPSGVQQWIHVYNGIISNAFSGMYTNSNGESFIVGTNRAINKYLTLKYNTSGSLVWYNNYTPSEGSEAIGASIIANDSGNIYITGYTKEYDGASFTSRLSLTTIKYNSAGAQIWASSYIYQNAFSGYSKGRAITLDDQSNVFVHGYRYIEGTSHSADRLLLKYSNADGSIIAEDVYDNSGDDGRGDWLDPILIDDSNHIFISFESEPCSTCTMFDVVTMKYSQDADDGSLISESELPIKYNLSQNYPNPFNPSTKFSYSLKDNVNVKITIYDILGRVIRTLVNEYQDAGYKSVIWDGTNNNGINVSTGLYIYKMEAGSFINTKKMMFIK